MAPCHAVGVAEVRGNVEKYGDIERCEFHKGFFSDTMPRFKEPVAAACINVDLVVSTRDCLHYLYPLLSRGGVLPGARLPEGPPSSVPRSVRERALSGPGGSPAGSTRR